MAEKLIAMIDSIIAIYLSLPLVLSIAKEDKIYTIIYLAVFLFFIVLAVLVYFSVKRKKHDSKFYRKILFYLSDNCNYILKDRELYYEYSDRTHINHSKKFNIYARVSGVDSFTDRYVYSGDSTCTVRAPLSGQKIVDEFKDHGWNFYSIKSSTPIPKRCEQIFEMKMDTIVDSKKTAIPFLSTGIYEPTKHLKMEVAFKNGIIPKRPQLKIYRDYVERNPIIIHDLNFDTNECKITYELDYPILYYKYLVSWEF